MQISEVFGDIFLHLFFFTPKCLIFYTNFSLDQIFLFLLHQFLCYTKNFAFFLHQILKFRKWFFWKKNGVNQLVYKKFGVKKVHPVFRRGGQKILNVIKSWNFEKQTFLSVFNLFQYQNKILFVQYFCFLNFFCSITELNR